MAAVGATVDHSGRKGKKAATRSAAILTGRYANSVPVPITRAAIETGLVSELDKKPRNSRTRPRQRRRKGERVNQKQ